MDFQSSVSICEDKNPIVTKKKKEALWEYDVDWELN